MRIVVILLLLISIHSCRKARGLETNKEKKEFFEKIKGKWKAIDYYYTREIFDPNNFSNAYSLNEEMRNDTLIRIENNVISKFVADFHLDFIELKKMKLKYKVNFNKTQFFPSSLSENVGAEYEMDWNSLKNGEYQIHFNTPLLKMVLYGEELHLSYKVNNGQWLTSTDLTEIHYILIKE